MARQMETQSVEITRTANGYLVRLPLDLRNTPDRSTWPGDWYVFNDFDKAAEKVLAMLGEPEQD
jgi:hypothetical protein